MVDLERYHEPTGKLEARVKQWQAGIQPLLEEQDARPGFDIKAYGDRILHTLNVEVRPLIAVTVSPIPLALELHSPVTCWGDMSRGIAVVIASVEASDWAVSCLL